VKLVEEIAGASGTTERFAYLTPETGSMLLGVQAGLGNPATVWTLAGALPARATRAELTVTGSAQTFRPYAKGTAASTHAEFISGAVTGDSDVLVLLKNNIALNNTPWTPIGTDDGSSFSGWIIGQNYKLSGLRLADAAVTRYNGLFRAISDARVEDLKVELANTAQITNNFPDTDARYYGVIAGSAAGATILKNIAISGTSGGILSIKTTAGNNDFVGGLLGQGETSVEITDCCSSLPIRLEHSGADLAIAGGLVGYDGKITRSYTTGAVSVVNSSGQAGAGGLVGANGTVSSSYATGAVSGAGGVDSGVGGLIGLNLQGNNGGITNCYARGTVTAVTNGAVIIRMGGVLGGIANSTVTIADSAVVNMAFAKTGGGTGLSWGYIAGNDTGLTANNAVYANVTTSLTTPTGSAGDGEAADIAVWFAAHFTGPDWKPDPVNAANPPKLAWE
jgi:hypothetical protein